MKVTLNCSTSSIILGDGEMSSTRELMNIEEYMIYCARVSSKDKLNHNTAPKLLKYLIDNKHWSPFEMVSIGFEIETSRAIAQQLLRHRSFSFQEFSQRYAKVEEMEPVELRYQAATNRQSSTSLFKGTHINSMVRKHLEDSQELYNHLIKTGVAKECARMVLPLTTQTTIVMHGTLRSWIHFLEQRCSDHAQKEIREIAFKVRSELSAMCPWTCEALGWSNGDE